MARWITNSLDHRLPGVEVSPSYLKWAIQHSIGPPKAMPKHTVEQLQAMGIVGLYAREGDCLTRQRFLDWLGQQPDDREFNVLQNYRGDCMCPMMACAVDLGYDVVKAFINHFSLANNSRLYCDGWDLTLFSTAFGHTGSVATAKQIRDYLKRKEELEAT